MSDESERSDPPSAKHPLAPVARPRRAAIQPTRELTLGDLLSTVEPERYPAAIAARLRTLWPLPLGRLTAADLHFLIGQSIGASLVVPLALELLERDPLLAAAGEPGDLLAAVFGTARSHVAAREHLRRRALDVLAFAERRLTGARTAERQPIGARGAEHRVVAARAEGLRMLVRSAARALAEPDRPPA